MEALWNEIVFISNIMECVRVGTCLLVWMLFLFFFLFILRSRKSSLFLQSFRGNLMPEMHYAWERETLECCCCRYIYIKRKLCKLLSYSVAVYFFILRSKCKTFAVSHHWATWACLGPVDISFNINRQKNWEWDTYYAKRQKCECQEMRFLPWEFWVHVVEADFGGIFMFMWYSRIQPYPDSSLRTAQVPWVSGNFFALF